MCEILLFARNNSHSDPEKDRSGCYKRGMPVIVQPDGHVWGIEESKQMWLASGRLATDWPGNFVIVKIPGVSVAKVESLMYNQIEDDAGNPVYEEDGATPKRFRRRAWKVAVDSIPTTIKNKLLADGEVTVTPTQIRNYVKRIRDNSNYTKL